MTQSLTDSISSSLQDAPYLDLAPYMPDYYKPQYLLDFEDRLPSSMHGSDSLSLNSFNSVTSTNLEWDDSAIAPSSEGKCSGRPKHRPPVSEQVRLRAACSHAAISCAAGLDKAPNASCDGMTADVADDGLEETKEPQK